MRQELEEKEEILKIKAEVKKRLIEYKQTETQQAAEKKKEALDSLIRKARAKASGLLNSRTDILSGNISKKRQLSIERQIHE